jgi:ABC-type bacteriocin/lantibiotic exporter with double-glycine peptidase domain
MRINFPLQLRNSTPKCLLSACIVLYLMFVLSWKLTSVTVALAPLCILAAVISSYISSGLKTNRLQADNRAAVIARLSLQHPAAVKALCIEDAVAAHYGSLHDAFIASFSPFKNSVCRILVSASFQVCACPRPESASNF